MGECEGLWMKEVLWMDRLVSGFVDLRDLDRLLGEWVGLWIKAFLFTDGRGGGFVDERVWMNGWVSWWIGWSVIDITCRGKGGFVERMRRQRNKGMKGSADKV